MSDALLFLKRFVSKPTQVGSVIPSSRFLCGHMMNPIPWNQVKAIAELGPGTGVFTKEIMKKMNTDTIFFAVEQDQLFQNMLRKRFPELIIRNEAVDLPKYMAEFGLAKLDVIVSGLPFAAFPAEKRAEILDSIEESLADNGIFVTFQYSLQLKEELKKRFAKVEIQFTMLNVPPAFIYTCCRQ